MKVYVVHTSWCSPDSGDYSEVEGVFSTNEAAEAHRLDVIRQNAAWGNIPYISADGVENPEWDFDVMIAEHEVK